MSNIWSIPSTQQPYNHNNFSKNIKTFYSLTVTILSPKILRSLCASRKKWMITVFLQRMPKDKLSIFLINTLLLHFPLLALTDRRNDRKTNTPAARGLEELFFQLCCCVSVFWFWQEVGFGVLTYLEYNTVVVLC